MEKQTETERMEIKAETERWRNRQRQRDGETDRQKQTDGDGGGREGGALTDDVSIAVSDWLGANELRAGSVEVRIAGRKQYGKTLAATRVKGPNCIN